LLFIFELPGTTILVRLSHTISVDYISTSLILLANLSELAFSFNQDKQC
jgi:hypothetical protein